jgi:fluoride ion exporter CrcB/FEX
MWLQIMSVVGALMVLAAYGLNQSGIWRELHAGYLALNIVGSLLLGVVAIVDQRAGFILLEFAWAALGLIGVARAVRAKHQQQSHNEGVRSWQG